MAGAGKRRAREKAASDRSSVSSVSNDKPEHKHFCSPSGLDGNRDPTTRSRSTSVASASRAQPPESSTSAAPPGNINTRLDIGASGSFLANQAPIPTDLPRRPQQGNKTGKEISVRLNTFNTAAIPSRAVYQYDVSIPTAADKRGFKNALWNSETVQRSIGRGWIFDGNQIAWGVQDIGQRHIEVDMDEVKGRAPRNGKTDKHTIRLRRTAIVPFDQLNFWLQGRTSFDSKCLDSINFLDHLMRQSPSLNFTSIKRNFFPRSAQRMDLGGGIEAFKGVYTSLRPVSTGFGTPATMSVNVDVANGTFWNAIPMLNMAMLLTGARDIAHCLNMLAQKTRDGRISDAMTMLKKLRKVRVICKHRGTPDEYVIDSITSHTSRTLQIEAPPQPGKPAEKMTVEQFFYRRYNKVLENPDAPLVKMTKGKNTVLPMELCQIKENQRYPFKLSDKQTSEMIKFCVTLPAKRWEAVQNGLKMLNWDADQYLKNYGLTIKSQPVQAKARVLPPPKVTFANGDVEPKYSGRWDLRGKTFLRGNDVPLKSWGVCIIPGFRGPTCRTDEVDRFLKTLITVYRGHGGKVANDKPFCFSGPADAERAVEELYNRTGNAFQMRPQLLVFIVPDKNSTMYLRIKKVCDCRYGLVSQVLQSAHVCKNQAQYCSNVCMKINAKLGGVTAKSTGSVKKTWFSKPTVVIGADVSHGAPGGGNPSIASITMSWDREAIKYIASVETNGSRLEMITKENIFKMVQPMLARWSTALNGGRLPSHLIYMRDGVSEGQFSHVLKEEVASIRDLLQTMNAKEAAGTKMTVIVCSKRHHIRFFPDSKDADRNGNPLPGTLVEVGCTHPFEDDFYLCAHSAIKGTARPVHYNLLLDEEKMDRSTLANFLYEASYQYVRSTTPVSYFPAIYYAHLAANRANSHINRAIISDKKAATSSSSGEVDGPLIEMPATMRGSMWFV